MKRLLLIGLCICVICMVTAPALAVNFLDYQYTDEDGVKVIDIDAYNAAVAAEKVAEAGLDLDVSLFWQTDSDGIHYFDVSAFDVAYETAVAAQDAVSPVESVGASNDDTSSPDVVAADTSEYPDVIYTDDSGDVWSAAGELLSSDAASDAEPDEIDPYLDDVLDAAPSSEVPPAADSVSVYSVSDLRSADDTDVSSDVGLKALITSIFGEYTPVMTTGVVTETVGDETVTTLIDTVAPGAAGVDYEWCAGVLLFAILLFCLMKLLGGVMK